MWNILFLTVQIVIAFWIIVVYNTKEALEQAGLEFKNKINSNVIKKLIEECPQEWRPMQENENALVEYLMYRINHFDTIISTILNYIK